MCPLLSEAHNISDRTMYKHVSGRFLSRAQNQILCVPQSRTSSTTDTRHNCTRHSRLTRKQVMNRALLDHYLLCNDTLPESKQ